MVGARGFAHYVTGILPVPASAPLRSLTRPSLAAFLTFSQRSLRFKSSLESNNKKALPKKNGKCFCCNWSGREDLNLRPPAPEAGALPDCATPRYLVFSEVRRTYLASLQRKSKDFCGCCGGILFVFIFAELTGICKVAL